jgi:hypothetical protein
MNTLILVGGLVIVGLFAVNKVIPTAPVCGEGAFLDVGRGKCYKCPEGYTRTLSAIDAPDACKLLKSCEEAFPGSKLDVATSKCWECPQPYERTVYHINDEKSCQSTCPKLYGDNSFEDGLSGNCYKCPDGYNNVVLEPITSNKKCQITSCGNIRTYNGENVFGDPDGGCYSCPQGYIRTWDSITSDTACVNQSNGKFSKSTFLGGQFKPVESKGNVYTKAKIKGELISYGIPE